MSEPALRVVLVAAIVAAGVLVVTVARLRERRRVRDAPLRLDAIEGSILFFSAADCARCGAVRALLDRMRLPYHEVAHEDAPGVQERVGVKGVPLVVVRNAAGEEVARFAGRVSARRLRRGAAAALEGRTPPQITRL